MATITRIKAQKNQRRVNIFLDGKYAFPLDVDNFVKARLKVGQRLSDKQIESLIEKNEFQKLLNKVLRLISFRPRSEREIRDYLKKKASSAQLTPKLTDKILAKLKKLGVLDDEAFARWWLEQRATFRPRGKYGLRAELRQKGVDREIIEQVVEQEVNELLLAKKVAQKKVKTLKKLPEREFRQKLAAFLSRRGFSWSVIKKVIDESSQKR